MATTLVVIDSGKFMSSIEYSKRLPNITRLVISKKLTAIGQKLHHGGTVTSSQPRRRSFSVYSSTFKPPGNHHHHHPPLPPSSWQQCIFRIITTVIVPFFSKEWTRVLKIKDEVDTVVEETEKIVDCVEEVAETVDKVAKDMAEHLPEGGQWRNAAVFVEGVAEAVAREAHLVEDFLHDVEQVEDKLELLVESVRDQTKNIHPDFNTNTQNIL